MDTKKGIKAITGIRIKWVKIKTSAGSMYVVHFPAYRTVNNGK